MNNIIFGDCLIEMNHIDDKSIDMVFCDLPYNRTACSWDSTIPLDKLWGQYDRVVKDDGAIVLTAQQPFTSMLVTSNLPQFRYEWIWEKPQGTNPRVAKQRPLPNHESVLIFYKREPVYYPQLWYSTPYSGFVTKNGKTIGGAYSGKVKSIHRDNPSGERYPKTVQKFKQDKGLHPTQKPVSLVEYFIKTYSTEGNLILDNCCGSGTTGIACLRTNRRYILMDNGVDDRKQSPNFNRRWADISQERIENERRDQSVRN